jgi:DDE superfamily endonuclease
LLYHYPPLYIHPYIAVFALQFVSQATMLLTPIEVRDKGLHYCAGTNDRCSDETKAKQFHAHYGSPALVLANLWFDLTVTDIPGAALEEQDKTEAGFKMFLVAHYFLWTYPKNSFLLASQFGISERYSRGVHIWRWVARIAAMKEDKIKWPSNLDRPESERFIITVDGTDFRMNEMQHPTMPVDRRQFSHKFNHGAVKYEIGISVFDDQCVWISGPHPGGKHDLTIFREGLKAKIRPGKLVIADRGYRTSRDDEAMLCPPDEVDSPALNNFKSRARLQHETFNGRLKRFQCLSETFRHTQEKHRLAFEAVCVITQYQMDNGSPLYEV